jgi:hypothetical protein
MPPDIGHLLLLIPTLQCAQCTTAGSCCLVYITTAADAVLVAVLMLGHAADAVLVPCPAVLRLGRAILPSWLHQVSPWLLG